MKDSRTHNSDFGRGLGCGCGFGNDRADGVGRDIDIDSDDDADDDDDRAGDRGFDRDIGHDFDDGDDRANGAGDGGRVGVGGDVGAGLGSGCDVDYGLGNGRAVGHDGDNDSATEAWMLIRFTIPGEPVAWARPRVVTTGPFPRFFEAKEVTSWRQHARLFALEAMRELDGRLLSGPLSMSCTFYFSRPGRLVWKTRPMPEVHKDTKPDDDNLRKALSDAFEGIVYWNDAQISDAIIRKRYCPGPGFGDTRPRVEVVIEELAAGAGKETGLFEQKEIART